MRHSHILLLGWLIVWLTACEPTSSAIPTSNGPQSWIDAPLNASSFPLAPVEIVAHSADANSIVQMELSVDENSMGTHSNSDLNLTLLTMKKQWQPPAPGEYILRVRAQDTTGAWGDYAQAIVTIQGAVPKPLPVVVPSATPVTKPGAPTPSPLPAITNQRTPTRTIPTPTRTFTPIPRNTATSTRTSTPIPPPPGCSGTPVIASFSASPSTINAGNLATLSWGAVTNADSVEIDNGIGGVPAPGLRVVSPSVTTIYILTARCKGVAAIARAVVSVIQPPTSTPVLRQLPTSTPTRTPIIVR